MFDDENLFVVHVNGLICYYFAISTCNLSVIFQVVVIARPGSWITQDIALTCMALFLLYAGWVVLHIA
jgi:hypothetical protein